MTVGPTLVPLAHGSTVKGFMMPKIAMEGMDVVDVGIRRCFFFWRGGLSSTQILHIQIIYDIYIEDVR